MKLYIVRHGQAASSDVDPARGLTAEGRAEAQKVAEFLRPLEIVVDCVWHSGKLRAAQTAEILSEAVTVKEGVGAHAGLGPNDKVSPIRDQIESAGQDVMIVGHLPFVGRLAALLLTGSDSACPIAFKEVGIVCLDHPTQDHWQIEWMIVPELILLKGEML